MKSRLRALGVQGLILRGVLSMGEGALVRLLLVGNRGLL